jgi:N-acetylglucosamine kinase-like BadF-type ATPase
MPYVLAVDGGNTKTLALVSALDGTILGAARGGCGDIYNAEPVDGAGDSAAAALMNTERTILAALRAASAAPIALAAGVFNMAGADWPEDIAFWRDAMTSRGYGRRVFAQNDALGVLYVGSADATGVSVVCGTGAATGARAADGQVWHSSFWQDEVHGSTHLGQKTLFAIYRSALGIEPPTALTARVLKHYGARSTEEVLHLFHSRLHPAPAHVDQLTPMLLDEADAGDDVAVRVVQEHGGALGKIAIAAARKVGLEGAFPLILAGGVFQHPTAALADSISESVRTAFPAITPVRCGAEPVAGVLLQALAAAGVTIDSAIRERVLASVTPAALATHVRV